MSAQFKPPYYAVIFTSTLNEDTAGYAEMADKMFELASQQAGFIGFESAREQIGITISYWQDLESIRQWKQNTEHLMAQKLGRERWYKSYQVHIAKVERFYQLDDQ